MSKLHNINANEYKKKPWVTFAVLLFTIITTGMILRYLVCLNVHNTPSSDFLDYYNRAVAFSQDKAFYTPFKPMGYPIILGIWFKIVGDSSIAAGKYLNLIISGLTLFSAYFLTRQLKLGKQQSLLLVAIVALFPMSVFYTNTLGVETITVFLIFLLINIYLWEGKTTAWILIGITAGVLATLRPFYILIPFGMFVIWLSIIKENRPDFISIITISISMFITITPFIIKNYNVTGQVMLVPSNASVVMYINNNNNNIHGGYLSFDKITPSTDLLNSFDSYGFSYDSLLDNQFRNEKEQAQYYSLLKTEALRWIRINPMSFLHLVILRIRNVFFHPSSIYFPLHEFYPRNSRYVMFWCAISDSAYYIMGSSLILYLLRATRNFLLSFFTKVDLKPIPVFIYVFSAMSVSAYVLGEGQARYFLSSLYPVAVLSLMYL